MEVKKEGNQNNQVSKVLLIIPCYNEEPNVLALYQSIQSALPYSGFAVDVLFIDD